MKHATRVLFIRGSGYQTVMSQNLHKLCTRSIHMKDEYHDIADIVYYDGEWAWRKSINMWRDGAINTCIHFAVRVFVCTASFGGDQATYCTKQCFRKAGMGFHNHNPAVRLDIFKRNVWNWNLWILCKISLNFDGMVQINNIPALIQIMAWRRRIHVSLGVSDLMQSWKHIISSSNVNFDARLFFPPLIIPTN